MEYYACVLTCEYYPLSLSRIGVLYLSIFVLYFSQFQVILLYSNNYLEIKSLNEERWFKGF